MLNLAKSLQNYQGNNDLMGNRINFNESATTNTDIRTNSHNIKSLMPNLIMLMGNNDDDIDMGPNHI